VLRAGNCLDASRLNRRDGIGLEPDIVAGQGREIIIRDQDAATPDRIVRGELGPQRRVFDLLFKLGHGDTNLNALHELFIGINREPLIAQKFLADVEKGDKRVILIDGEPVGAINRVPAAGETRSNMHVGGRPEKIALDDRDLEICARIGPVLREKGLLFTGIDVIGGWMTEINVTSPTGIQELERFDGTNVAVAIWEAIEGRRAA